MSFELKSARREACLPVLTWHITCKYKAHCPRNRASYARFRQLTIARRMLASCVETMKSVSTKRQRRVSRSCCVRHAVRNFGTYV